MLIIDTLSKVYSNGRGLISASFEAENGDVVALLGPNGSGKTTIMKIICDVITPDYGDCTLNGVPTNLCKSEIGYLPETPYLLYGLTGLQFLRYMAGMRGESDFSQTKEMIDFFQVNPYINERIGNLSQGQSKRIALISALIGDPYLLVLDEPTNGFDTLAILKIKELLQNRITQGKITLFSSHVLDFVKSVAKKIVFIKKGSTLPMLEHIEDVENKYIEIFSSNNG